MKVTLRDGQLLIEGSQGSLRITEMEARRLLARLVTLLPQSFATLARRTFATLAVDLCSRRRRTARTNGRTR
jgi:lauroyl/myristoyl acyltransferase